MNHCRAIVVAMENDPSLQPLLQRTDESDSNLRCCKGGWFRLLRSFAAARFSDRLKFSLPQGRMVPPPVVVAATRSASDSILRCR